MTATRLRLAVLAALAAVHVLVSLFAVTPGYLSIDEATYHLMTKYLAEDRGLEVWNGYRELPSPELISASITAHEGRLVGRPPVLHPVLGVPFYRLWGYRGLFALNALAFLAVAALTFVLARRLFADVDLALDACIVLALATFTWEYSQAAWTHMTALLFNLGAATPAILGLLAGRRPRGAWLAFAAGLVAGLGIGIRLDLVFVLACVLLIYLFRSPWLPRHALAAAAGALPGLAGMALVNQARFGTLSPLSMGVNVGLPEIARYLPLLGLGTVALTAAWALSRGPTRRLLARRPRAAWLVAGALAVVVLVLPATRKLALDEMRGLYTLGVDLRALDLDRREPAMQRSPGRAVVYIGGVKKALLQSCPYLVLLLLPAARLVRGAGESRHRDAGRLALLVVVPAVYLGFYAQFSWHGGLSLNLRYLTAILPYTSVLTAYALRQARAEIGESRRRELLAAGLAALAVFVAGRVVLRATPGVELQFLTLPLLLAGGLLIALLMAWRGGRHAARAARTVWCLTAAGLVWAALVALTYDYPLADRTRRFHLETGRRTTDLVAPDSLFFADFVDPFFLLIEHDRVRIARPSIDGHRDMPRLTGFHLAAGRRVYGALDPRAWEILGRGQLAGFAVREIWRAGPFVLAEIERSADRQRFDRPSPPN